MKRFINADVIAGAISNTITLNRFAYANGNPVSFIDPFGLSVWSWLKENIVDPIGDADSAIGKAGADQFKKETASGNLDWLLDLSLGAKKDEQDIYHIDQNYWQSMPFVGYNNLYDKAFEIGVGVTGYTVDHEEFYFTYENKDYVIWMWKGDYINLGSGAEVGIYKESIIPGHYLTSKENSMTMSLKLQEIDTGKVLFDYHPSEKQWWINGFDPSNPNAYTSNLALTVTIDFSNNPDMYQAFKDAMEDKNEKWIFDDMQATYSWRNK